MKHIFQTGFFVFILIGFIGCTAYYITVESFKEQFNGIDSTSLKIVSTRGPAGDVAEYPANPIEYIKCIDKEGNPFQLKNSPSIEMRITENDNNRTIFYFDRVLLQDSLLIGDRSRFIYLPKAIPIDSVKLIEVQDGRKNFKYVETKKK
jgi:hypothetical protein